MKKYVSILIIIAGLLFIGIKLYRKNVAPAMKYQGTELTPLLGNNKTTINDLKGQVVIVSFFQSWCVDCAKETPTLNELSSIINNEKFKVLYISDEDINKIEGFRNRFPTDKIIFTKSTASLSSLGIHVYPTTYLLNKKGETILAKLEGYDWLQEKAQIEKLLAE
ncbi:MAG: redoxin domain-containing protein [Ferruginibacter sp.]|nr:redoxin domain-containing protein [Ferruginibacter sp.]